MSQRDDDNSPDLAGATVNAEQTPSSAETPGLDVTPPEESVEDVQRLLADIDAACGGSGEAELDAGFLAAEVLRLSAGAEPDEVEHATGEPAIASAAAAGASEPSPAESTVSASIVQEATVSESSPVLPEISVPNAPEPSPAEPATPGSETETAPEPARGVPEASEAIEAAETDPPAADDMAALDAEDIPANFVPAEAITAAYGEPTDFDDDGFPVAGSSVPDAIDASSPEPGDDPVAAATDDAPAVEEAGEPLPEALVAARATEPQSQDDASPAPDSRREQGTEPRARPADAEATLREIDGALAEDVEDLLAGNFETVSDVLDEVYDDPAAIVGDLPAPAAGEPDPMGDASTGEKRPPKIVTPTPPKSPDVEAEVGSRAVYRGTVDIEDPAAPGPDSEMLPAREPVAAPPPPEPAAEAEGDPDPDPAPDPEPEHVEAIEEPEVATIHREAIPASEGRVEEDEPSWFWRIEPILRAFFIALNAPLRRVPPRARPVLDWIALSLVFWVPIVWVVAVFLVGR